MDILRYASVNSAPVSTPHAVDLFSAHQQLQCATNASIVFENKRGTTLLFLRIITLLFEFQLANSLFLTKPS